MADGAELDPTQHAAWRRDGHLLVRQLLDPVATAAMVGPYMAAIDRSGRAAVDLSTLDSAYERAFVQLVNPSLDDPALRPLAHSRRLGAVMARLLGADGVRLMVEDVFLKPPGADPTPWHQDASVSPVDPDAVITAWVPLHPVDAERGGLRLVTGSHVDGILDTVDISEQSQRLFDQLIEARGLSVWEAPAMAPGDVSFHRGSTVHGAWGNRSDQPRLAVALHCFADGARIAPVRSPQQQRLLDQLAPGRVVGDPARSDSWPLIYGADA